jgi:hypothetical protein
MKTYTDVYNAMNELSMCESGLDELKVLIGSCMDTFNDSYPGRSDVDHLLSATYRFLNYYIDEYDKKFQDAWSVAIQAGRELDQANEELQKLKNPEPPNTDRVVKWILPVEQFAGSDEYLISFPEDLLEAANLKEGDQVEWIDRGDGSYELRKVTNGTI